MNQSIRCKNLQHLTENQEDVCWFYPVKTVSTSTVILLSIYLSLSSERALINNMHIK